MVRGHLGDFRLAIDQFPGPELAPKLKRVFHGTKLYHTYQSDTSRVCNTLTVQNRSGSIAFLSECLFFPVDTLQNGHYPSTLLTLQRETQ